MYSLKRALLLQICSIFYRKILMKTPRIYSCIPIAPFISHFNFSEQRYLVSQCKMLSLTGSNVHYSTLNDRIASVCLLSSVVIIKLEALGRIQTTKAFQILIPSFFFQREEYNLLLPLLINSCSVINPFVYQRFYKVLFESISFSNEL